MQNEDICTIVVMNLLFFFLKPNEGNEIKLL